MPAPDTPDKDPGVGPRAKYIGAHLHPSRRVPRYLYEWLREKGFRIVDVGEPLTDKMYYLPWTANNYGDETFKERREYCTDLHNWQPDTITELGTPVEAEWCVNIVPGDMPPPPDQNAPFDFEANLREIVKYKACIDYLSKDGGFPGEYVDAFRALATLVRDTVDALEEQVNRTIKNMMEDQ
jgi:hypothetical protein